MMLLGAAVIGFLIGLVVCYWKQLQAAYKAKDTLGAVSDIQTGVQGVQNLLHQL